MPNLITLSPRAVERLRHILAQQNPAPEGVLVSVMTKGCSGLRYDVSFLPHLADKPAGADVVVQDGLTVVIDPKATLYLVGAVMDYTETLERSGFDFANPNETGRCGCGESFTVG